METRQIPQDMRRLSRLLDSEYDLPFGWKIGWDGILGFVPGLGDLMTNSLSFYIIYRAAMLGCSPSVILRMGINLFIDNLVSAVPLIGHIFDFMWKANNRNLELTERYLANPSGTQASSRFVVLLVLILIFISMIATVAVTVWFFSWLWNTFSSPNPQWY